MRQGQWWGSYLLPVSIERLVSFGINCIWEQILVRSEARLLTLPRYLKSALQVRAKLPRCFSPNWPGGLPWEARNWEWPPDAPAKYPGSKQSRSVAGTKMDPEIASPFSSVVGKSDNRTQFLLLMSFHWFKISFYFQSKEIKKSGCCTCYKNSDESSLVNNFIVELKSNNSNRSFRLVFKRTIAISPNTSN